MKILVRAVISGFGYSLGAALYKRLAKQLGLDESLAKEDAGPSTAVGNSRSGDADEADDPGTAQLYPT